MLFDQLPLHDATLDSISYEWAAKSVCLKGKLWDSASNSIGEFHLKFLDVEELNLKQNRIWGESSQINKAWCEELNHFNIEIQSGDIIFILAESFVFGVSSGLSANENN